MKTISIGLYLLFIFSAFSTTHAQPRKEGETVQGFVINNQGDTIHGKIKLESLAKSQVHVKFYERRGATYFKKKTYKPKHLQGYAFKVEENNNNKTQRVERWIAYTRKKVDESPIPFASKTVFLERKVSGMLNLYNCYIQSNLRAKLKRVFYLERANSKKMQKITETDFAKVSSTFLKDCAVLVDRVGRGDFNYFNLDIIVWNYNRCNIEDMPDDSCTECDEKEQH